MAQNIFDRIALGLTGGAQAQASYDLQQQRIDLQRQQQLTQQQQFSAAQQQDARTQAVAMAMQVLQRAPMGSKARALAIVAMRDAGVNNENLLEALQTVGPQAGAPGKRTKLSPGDVLFGDAPGGGVQELARVPKAQPTVPKKETEGERNLQRILDLVDKGNLSAREQRELDMRREAFEARNQPDPMKQFMSQFLGAGQAPGTSQLDAKQEDAINRARQAVKGGKASPERAQRLLVEKYGLTQEQDKAALQ